MLTKLTTQRITDHLQMSASVGRGLPEFARSFDVDIEPVAEAMGVDCSTFERAGVRISSDRFCRLLEALALISNIDEFGLRFGDAFRLGGTGAFGYGLRSAPNVRGQIDFMVKYFPTHNDVSFVSREIGNGQLRLEWAYSAVLLRLDQFVDYEIRLFVRHLQRCLGQGWLPISVETQRRAPRSRALYRQLLSPQITFGSDCNAVTISDTALAAPNPGADSLLFELMSAECGRRVRAFVNDKNIKQRVEEEILLMLETGAPTAAKVAEQLRMSERSLQRRLAENSTSFQTLVDEVRRELSDRLLADDRLTIAEISHQLGFSSPSAYTRSAARWYGAAPSTVRQGYR